MIYTEEVIEVPITAWEPELVPIVAGCCDPRWGAVLQYILDLHGLELRQCRDDGSFADRYIVRDKDGNLLATEPGLYYETAIVHILHELDFGNHCDLRSRINAS